MGAADERSFEQLAIPHLGLVYRVARRLCRNEHEAEDLTQETFLKAHRSFDRFEMREFGIRPWLLRILRNTFLNRQAKDRRVSRNSGQETLDQAAETLGGGQPAALDYDRLDAEVKSAIDGLPEEFRDVLLLWATMELSYQEIAGILEVPIGTVMSRLHRARQQLSVTLADYAKENRLGASRDHA